MTFSILKVLDHYDIAISNRLGRKAVGGKGSLIDLFNDKVVCRAAPGFARVCKIKRI